MTTEAEQIRRVAGPVASPTGTPARRAQAQRVGDSKRKTTRFRMIGQTVCIHCPRDEWSEVKDRYATVIKQWCDGSVLVEVARWYGKKAQICFSRHEVEHVALNDAILHNADEECALVSRSVELHAMANYVGMWKGRVPDKGWLSERIQAALRRRADILTHHIRAIQRERRNSLADVAKWERLGLSNSCTAIVPFEGRAS